MRRLNTKDCFACMRLIKQTGMKEKFRNIAERVNGNANMKELGIDLVLDIIDGLADVGAERRLYEFLAGPFEMKVEDIEALQPLDLLEKLKELAQTEDKEGWKAFFQSVQSLTR